MKKNGKIKNKKSKKSQKSQKSQRRKNRNHQDPNVISIEVDDWPGFVLGLLVIFLSVFVLVYMAFTWHDYDALGNFWGLTGGLICVTIGLAVMAASLRSHSCP